MSEVFSILRREARRIDETPFGSVGALHTGQNLHAWWILKDGEEVDPDWTVFSREDFLYVVQGTLELELADGPTMRLEAGQCFVIPAGQPFRGYRWPRDGEEPCMFLAVASADVETSKISPS